MTRSYVSNLRKGRIENPGFEKLRAIAEAMNFPPELWFEDVENEPDVSSGRPSWFLDRDDKPTLLDAAVRGGAGYERRKLVAFGGLAPRLSPGGRRGGANGANRGGITLSGLPTDDGTRICRVGS